MECGNGADAGCEGCNAVRIAEEEADILEVLRMLFRLVCSEFFALEFVQDRFQYSQGHRS